MESYESSCKEKKRNRRDEQNFAYNFKKFKDPSPKSHILERNSALTHHFKEVLKLNTVNVKQKLYLITSTIKLQVPMKLLLGLCQLIDSFIHLFDKCFLAPTMNQGMFWVLESNDHHR